MATDVLLIFLQDQWYVPDTDAPSNFDTSILGDLLGADVGWPVTESGSSLQFAKGEKQDEEVLQTPIHYPTGTCYNERYVVSDDEEMSTQVELATGEQVSVGDYEVVLVSHFWMHHFYLSYLLDEFPEVSFIGVQEESVQDVMQSSSRLQMAHFDTITRLDGYIAFNEQFRRWIAPHCPNVLKTRLPVPKQQFDDIDVLPRDQRRNAVCLGTGTWNIDLANFYSNVRVLERVRESDAKYQGEIVGILDRQRPDTDGFTEQLEFVSVEGFIDEDWYARIADFDFAILLSARATADRVAADLAGVGVPCIGNLHNDFQSLCFPDLSVEPHDVSTAVTLAEQLLHDDQFWQQTVAQARRQIQKCQDHDHFRTQIKAYVDEIRSN